ncbi:DUF29 domain-containing protein [Aureimonas flava]|uniref:DUF29 domain-containing protein n=1 Tax=Aureimonas flava TaxID=2320271 RepID=A0A3A1WJI8_9HYPH|nr:DUF29 domain-containing protein [Aureimonas flava]RIY00112.1 DUF29 domain-containing protein [Aureimonas flava]
MAKPHVADAPLHERDANVWTQNQAAKPRARTYASIDRRDTAEELESLGALRRGEIESRRNVPLPHFPKGTCQPSLRSGGRKGAIAEQRRRLHRRMTGSPSLKIYPDEVLAEEFARAGTLAASGADLPGDAFPQSCPFRLEDILLPDFYPDGE